MGKFSVWNSRGHWLGNVEAEDSQEALELARLKYAEAKFIKLVYFNGGRDLSQPPRDKETHGY